MFRRLADRPQTAAVVRDALAALWPGRFEGRELEEQLPLGEEGLGLDSIGIVELLLECEDRVGRPASRAEELIEGGPITVGQLIDHLLDA